MGLAHSRRRLDGVHAWSAMPSYRGHDVFVSDSGASPECQGRFIRVASTTITGRPSSGDSIHKQGYGVLGAAWDRHRAERRPARSRWERRLSPTRSGGVIRVKTGHGTARHDRVGDREPRPEDQPVRRPARAHTPQRSGNIIKPTGTAAEAAAVRCGWSPVSRALRTTITQNGAAGRRGHNLDTLFLGDNGGKART